MISEDTSVRDINKVEDAQALQKKTLEVLNSLSTFMQQSVSKKPIGFDTDKPTKYKPDTSPISRGGPGDTLSGYFKDKFTGLISKITKPLENVMGLDLKRIAGGLRNIITNTSQSERELKKLTKQQEKEKLAALKEEMRLGKKQLASIGIKSKNIEHARLRDPETGQFKADPEGMTRLDKIRALTHQYEGDIAEKGKSRYARQIEKLTGKSPVTTGRSSFSPRGEGDSKAIGFDTTPSGAQGKLDSVFVSEKISPTIKDLAKTASGQAMIWYYNQSGKKVGGPEEGGGGGVLDTLLGTLLGGTLGKILPALLGFLPALLPILGVLAGAGAVAALTWAIAKMGPTEEEKKAMERVKKERPGLSDEEVMKQVNREKWDPQKQLGKKVKPGQYYDHSSGTLSTYDSLGDVVEQKYVPLSEAEPFLKSGKYKSQMEFVQDAVITKAGQIIHTSPEDTIIATKNDPRIAKGQGFDGDLNSILANINKRELERGTSDIVMAIKEQTAILKEKVMGNVINNNAPNEFNFDNVRLTMSYGNGVV